MDNHLSIGFGLLLYVASAFAGQDVASAVQDTVKRIDAGAKTIIVTTADGTQDAVHFVGRTAVHGADAAAAGSKETLHGINVGSEVAVHYTTTGTQRTAHEIDDVGKTGLRSAEGTVKSIYRGTKTLTLKTADGAEETYRLADRAARDTGQDIGEGAEKSGKVTVYYSEEAGHKVAHFFKRML
jgi:hypothetical protein